MGISSLNNFEKPNNWAFITNTLDLDAKLSAQDGITSYVVIFRNGFNNNNYINVKRINILDMCGLSGVMSICLS